MRRLMLAASIGLLLLGSQPVTAHSVSPSDDVVGVVFALESAIDGGNPDQSRRLFTDDCRVADGAVYLGADQATTWVRELAVDRTWMDVTGAPEVSQSSGQPLAGWWAIAPVTMSRQSFRLLGVDPMPATLAMIVQGTQIAYVSVRPDMLWLRAYQSARVMSLRAPLPSP